MLNSVRMNEQVSKYLMSIEDDCKKVYIVKDGSQNWVKISTERAIEWVNAGIEDIDCRSKEEMLQILNSWLYGGNKDDKTRTNG